jgi:flagellar basal-body rod protein FlgF
MNVSIYQAAAALSAFDRAQEVIAENMASASVNGFKKQVPSFSAVQAGLVPAPGVNGAGQYFLLPRTTCTTSFEPGQTKYTGSKTDVAIDGPGFFEVHLPKGGVYYTRDGEFKLGSKGQLITKGGGRVMGQGGPLQVDMTRRDAIVITPAGEIMQGNNTVGKLKIVDFDDPQRLTAIGNGNFTADAPEVLPVPVTNPIVSQGFVEGSNASIMKEMATLLTNIRQYETNQRVIQLHDERMGHAITTLGETGS